MFTQHPDDLLLAESAAFHCPSPFCRRTLSQNCWALGGQANCCKEPQGSGPSENGQSADGGGRIGAVVISPYVKSGLDTTKYNHYSLLKSIESLFDLPPLGEAGRQGLPEFGPDVYDDAP